MLARFFESEAGLLVFLAIVFVALMSLATWTGRRLCQCARDLRARQAARRALAPRVRYGHARRLMRDDD